MNAKREKKTATEPPVQKKTNAKNDAGLLHPITLLLALALTLLALTALAVQLLVLRPASHDHLLWASRLQAEHYARATAFFLSTQEQRLGDITSDPAILAALDGKNHTALQAAEQNIHTFSRNSTLHLIPLDNLGTASPDFPSTQFNNIEIDLIRRSIDEGKTLTEAYKRGNRMVVTMVRSAVDKSGNKVGTVVLTMDQARLRGLLEQLSGGQGMIMLQQLGANNKSLPVTAFGQAPVDAPEVSATFGTTTHWRLVFRPGKQMLANAGIDNLRYWSVFAAAAAILLGGGLIAWRSSARAFRGEAGALIDYLHRRLAGERVLPPELKIAQLDTIGSLTMELSAAQPTAAPEPAAKPAPEPEPEPEPEATPELELPDLDAAFDAAEAAEQPGPIARGIFRAYDIRGVVGRDLTDDTTRQIGRAIAAEVQAHGQHSVIVGRDGRLSSPQLAEQLMAGLMAGGCDVIDIGAVPTPVLYFATHELDVANGVMVTGSHNPPDYNGFKIVIDGETLALEQIEGLYERIVHGDLTSGKGRRSDAGVVQRYIDYIVGDIAVAQPLKIVVDCGNGIAGNLAPALLEELGCEVVPLYCDVDGNFPNHHPDPTRPANLRDLISAVADNNADLGIAFDGDGDRLGVVSRSGRIIPADQLLMLIAQDVVSRNPGCDVVFDVKCTRHLNQVISGYGGRPIMWKSGHSLIKRKMVETGALLAGEYSGHIFFSERWFGFDDGIYSAARLIEILSTSVPDIEELLTEFPIGVSTPEIHLEVGEERKFEVVEQLAEHGAFGDGKINRIDGLRVDYEDGWGLARASNTTPDIVLRFEGEDAVALDRIKGIFRDQLAAVAADIAVDF